MTWRTAGIGAISAAAAAGLFAQVQTPPPAQTPPPGQAVFRTTTDLVTVDVAVRMGNTPVGNLKTSDFVLLDNGVPQHIDSLDVEAVPVDVTIIVDTSEAMTDYIGSLNGQVQKIASLVRPDDRLRVMQIDTYVAELFPMQRAGTHPAIGKLTVEGLDSVNDALAAALLRTVEPNRRHLVIALTDGIDTISTLSIAAVRDIARQSSATLHVVWITMEVENPPFPAKPYWTTNLERRAGFRCGYQARCTPTHRFWAPFKEPPGNSHSMEDFGPLRDAAESTGGQLHDRGGIFFDKSVTGIFEKVYADYRRNYLLRFTPQGVTREGWHEIKVTIPAYPAYVINARRGYAIEPDLSVPLAASTVVAPDERAGRALGANAAGTLQTLLDAYARGDYEAAQTAGRNVRNWATFAQEFQAAGNFWPAAPHREEVLALEVVNAALPSPHVDERQAARKLLLAYSTLVREPLPVDNFERDWRRVALAILEAAIDPAVTQDFVTTASKYFPDDPTFTLGKAFALDQRWRQSTADGVGAPRAAFIDEVIAAYNAAMRFDDVTFEARVREGWLLHRVGRNADALAMLDAANDRPAGGRVPDKDLIYLRHLFRGHVLDALGRLDEAAVAFRAAQSAVPNAQSASVALMNVALRQGDQATARKLAEAVQTAPSIRDPWWSYWQGDYRFYPDWITELRRQVR